MAVFVYTEQETSPRFFEVIQSIKDAMPEVGAVLPVTAEGAARLAPHQPVVVFGNITDPEYTHTNNVFTYSPAQALTKANSVTVVGTALMRGANLLPTVKTEPQGTFVYTADHDANIWEHELAALAQSPALALDIEVSGNIKTGTVEDEDVRLLTVAFYDPSRDCSVVFEGGWYGNVMSTPALSAFLRAYRGQLIYHNGKFDTRVLNRVLGFRVPVHQDTMLMHHVLNQAAGTHGLKELCKLYFNAPEWEGDLKKYTKGGGHYENIPFNLLAGYNALDVYWTYVLFEYLSALIEADENALRAYELELEAAAFLLKVEERGIPFDVGAADSLETTCRVVMQTQLSVMQELANRPGFNPNSPKQVKEVMSSFGHDIPGTSVDILKDLYDTLQVDEVPAMFIDSLLKYRKNAKISSTYVKGWKNKARNGLVHPTFLVHGTSTGRLSSTSPNAQNMPRDKRVRAIVGI